jgi:hypothetical protein
VARFRLQNGMTDEDEEEQSLATNGEEEHSTATESRGGRRSLEHCSTVAA